MHSTDLKVMIPETKIEAVEEGLLVAFQTKAVDAITPLSGGLSTALVYKIVVKEKAFALRIILNVNALADPKRQYRCMKLAADAGIAPHVYYVSVENAISITDFVEVVPMATLFPVREDLLVALADTIKRLHATPVFPRLVNFMDALDGFVDEYKAAPIFPAEATDELFERYAQIQACYPRYDADLVSSHNDLNHRNVICDSKQIRIVDWEAAFQNDRYADIATIGNGYVNNEAQEELLLRAYFGDTLDESKRARYFLARQIRHLFYAMVMIRVALPTKPGGWVYEDIANVPAVGDFRRQIGSGVVDLSTVEGQLLFARVEMNEALNDMKSERFSGAVQVIETSSKPSVSDKNTL